MIVARLEGRRIPSRGTVPGPTGRSSETLSSKPLQSTGWRSKAEYKGGRSFHGCVICARAPRVSESPKLPERACINWYIKVTQALSAELCYPRRATHPSGENEKTKRKGYNKIRYCRFRASSHHLLPSSSDRGGSKYLHREANASMEQKRHHQLIVKLPRKLPRSGGGADHQWNAVEQSFRSRARYALAGTVRDERRYSFSDNQPPVK